MAEAERNPGSSAASFRWSLRQAGVQGTVFWAFPAPRNPGGHLFRGPQCTCEETEAGALLGASSITRSCSGRGSELESEVGSSVLMSLGALGREMGWKER